MKILARIQQAAILQLRGAKVGHRVVGNPLIQTGTTPVGTGALGNGQSFSAAAAVIRSMRWYG